MSESNKIFYVIPHSHIDVEWYWIFSTTQEWTADILHKAMQLLQQDPEFRFTQDQTVLLQSFWEELDEPGRAFFQQMVRERRLAIVGGAYVQPEVAEPNGESLIRQIITGQEWLGATLGIRPRCGWFIDTFGQVPQIPQILYRAGYEYNVFWRDIPLDIDLKIMPADFYWESPDGSRILTHWLPGGYSNNPSQIRMTLEHSRSRHVLLPLGGDVVRPTQDSSTIRREMADQLAKLGVEESEIRVTTALEYLDALAAEANQLPVLSYDFNPPFRAQDLRGTYDNRIELKKRNRLAEQALFNLETIAAIASAGGQTYPGDTLAELWQKLLFTQFHDTIGGSHHDPVYVAAMDRLESILQQTDPLTTEFLREIAPGGREAGDWIAVFNTLSFARSEVCRALVPGAALTGAKGLALQDADGQTMPVQIIGPAPSQGDHTDIAIEFVAVGTPATGYKAYRLITVEPPPDDLSYAHRGSGPNHIENSFFRVTWAPTTGDLISIWDKVRQRELLTSPGNVLVAAREQNPDMEGNIYLTGEEARSSDYQANTITVSQDPLALSLLIRSPFQDCQLLRKVILYDFAPRLKFQTTLEDFRGGDVLVKVSFPLSLDWNRVERTYETPFAATPRPDGHFAAQTWVDCSDGEYGAALLNHGTPGYWIGDGRLELVLLRSLANYTSYQKYGLPKGVPGYEADTQTALAREHGSHQFTYWLYPHAGDWREGDLSRLGQSLNTPLITLSGVGETVTRDAGNSFLACGPDFTMTALKQSQAGQGLVVRGFETRGRAHPVTMTLPPGVSQVYRASLLEEPGEQLPVVAGEVVFPCAPHEIVTLLLIP